MNAARKKDEPAATSFNNLAKIKPGSSDSEQPEEEPQVVKQFTIASIDAAVVEELKGFVWWINARNKAGLEGMRDYGTVLARAWRDEAQHYRDRFHRRGRGKGKPFPPADSLPGGRRPNTSKEGPTVYTRLQVATLDATVAAEIRGMVWLLMQLPQEHREGLNTLGDVIADLFRRWLPKAARQWNDGEPFTTAVQVPRGRNSSGDR